MQFVFVTFILYGASDFAHPLKKGLRSPPLVTDYSNLFSESLLFEATVFIEHAMPFVNKFKFSFKTEGMPFIDSLSFLECFCIFLRSLVLFITFMFIVQPKQSK